MKPYSFHNLIKALNPDLTWNEIEKSYYEIRQAYSEPHRFYHNWKHIEEGWKIIQDIKSLLDDPVEIEIAWYYHDIVYIPGSKFNEILSANKAKQACLTLKLPVNIDIISNLIIMGAESQESNNSDTNFFYDIDYSILGQSKKRYEEYVAGIIKEYAGAPFIKRLDFIKYLLSIDHIYRNDFFRLKYGNKAIRNLNSELNEVCPFCVGRTGMVCSTCEDCRGSGKIEVK